MNNSYGVFLLGGFSCFGWTFPPLVYHPAFVYMFVFYCKWAPDLGLLYTIIHLLSI